MKNNYTIFNENYSGEMELYKTYDNKDELYNEMKNMDLGAYYTNQTYFKNAVFKNFSTLDYGSVVVKKK